jgi:hypothetical protein
MPTSRSALRSFAASKQARQRPATWRQSTCTPQEVQGLKAADLEPQARATRCGFPQIRAFEFEGKPIIAVVCEPRRGAFFRHFLVEGKIKMPLEPGTFLFRAITAIIGPRNGF